MKIRNYHYMLSFSEMEIQITEVGRDYSIVIAGGDRPHVGCTVLAVPRPSLTGNGSVSATSSVLNVTGHQDENICRYLAEQVAKTKSAVVVCTGGFHVDHAEPEMIQEILTTVKRAAQEIALSL